MEGVLHSGRGSAAIPFDMVAEVSPEQVAATLARLETELKHLSATIDRLSCHLERTENRVSITEKLQEKASAAWWTVTKGIGVLAGGVGGIAWLLEHGSKFAVLMK